MDPENGDVAVNDDKSKAMLQSFLKGYLFGTDANVKRELCNNDIGKAAYARGQHDAALHFEEKLKELGIL